MDRSLGRALIGAAILLSPVALCEDWFAEQGPRLGITVRVFNYARLPDSELRRATDFATAVFQRAGVSVMWVRCRTSSEHATSNPVCGHPVRPADLLLNILTGSMSTSARAQ